MISKKITVTNSVGLHARPATYFIQKANNYKSSLWVECGDRRANAKSLLGILSLGITKGTKINIVADGPDEADALEGLGNLILAGFHD
jgi:phosphocarrier protein